MRKSWLPKGGENLFQGIKRKTAEARVRGINIIDLSIGVPAGAAFIEARQVAADAILSSEEALHAYQDNSCAVVDFARRFVQAHLPGILMDSEKAAFLAIPGIKPMLGLVPLACGGIRNNLVVATMTNPGYPVPATQCDYLRIANYSLPLNPGNSFRFNVWDIAKSTKLLMLNYPHNPSGQIVTEDWWQRICEYCEWNEIRLVNDCAYQVLSHDPESSTLAETAVDYPELSWMELFSVSKEIGNGTGWRVGAAVGSPDFVYDLATIKGNTDSGLVAPMAAGALYALENCQKAIDDQRKAYSERLNLLSGIFKDCGIRLALEPKAGFFVLCEAPTKAFGMEVKNAAAFNDLMIEEAGIVGVPFDPYIRYSVTRPVEEKAHEIEAAFRKAKISYWH